GRARRGPTAFADNASRPGSMGSVCVLVSLMSWESLGQEAMLATCRLVGEALRGAASLYRSPKQPCCGSEAVGYETESRHDRIIQTGRFTHAHGDGSNDSRECHVRRAG